MKESFLHFIWQYQLFKTLELRTTKGSSVVVKQTGLLNKNSGPDFEMAQLRIANQLWAGTIEVHVNSSDWYAHHHEKDPNYENVILHVVWNHDIEIFNTSDQYIPVLELKHFVSKKLLLNYQKLFDSKDKWINCKNEIKGVDQFLWLHWIERMYFERLEEKSEFIEVCLKKTNYDWEAVLFQLLARNFGLKVNAEAFFEMAERLKFSIIRKEQGKVRALECLMFGTLGMLDTAREALYYKELKECYEYQVKKYNIGKTPKTPVQFFRLRPLNFPTIRISQLANLYGRHSQLFSSLMNSNGIDRIYKLFDISTAPFWETHYTFDKASKKRKKKLSKSFIDLILINTIIPLKFVYLKHLGQPVDEPILDLIKLVKPERNSIISQFEALDLEVKSAMDTQALLYLKKAYCDQKKCLNCALGSFILKSESGA